MRFTKIRRKIKTILGIKAEQVRKDEHSEFKQSSSTVLINCKIELRGKSTLIIDNNVKLDNCRLVLINTNLHIKEATELIDTNIYSEGSNLNIDARCNIAEYDFYLNEAKLFFGESCYLYRGNNGLRPSIRINQGSLIVKNNNVIKAEFWIRFGGNCNIGIYNCINERTEIRCDELIEIGDFNLISYECNIWDTNTHNKYSPKHRRDMAIKEFPALGSEYEKPNCIPVIIGNDTWIGKRVIILKGTRLGDEAVIGVGAVVSNKLIPNNATAVGNPCKILTKE